MGVLITFFKGLEVNKVASVITKYLFSQREEQREIIRRVKNGLLKRTERKYH